MTKLRKIIKDIVRQQVEHANKMNRRPQVQLVKNVNRNTMIITDDGVGRR